MNAFATNTERYCSVEDSIIQASKEVRLMREGTLPKKSLSDLFNKIDAWKNEEKE